MRTQQPNAKVHQNNKKRKWMCDANNGILLSQIKDAGESMQEKTFLLRSEYKVINVSDTRGATERTEENMKNG